MGQRIFKLGRIVQTIRMCTWRGILGLSVVIGFAHAQELPQGGPFGSRDFVQYWSACRLLEGGINPYDAAAMHQVQKTAGVNWHQPVMMWNPPPALGLLCPMMGGGLESAAARWAVFNALAFILAALFTMVALGKGSWPWALTISLTFVPAWDNLLSGQLGAVLALGLGAFFLLERERKDFAAGFALVLLVPKFHLFHLIWIAVLYQCFFCKRQRMFLGLVTAVVLSSIYPLLSELEIFSNWWASVRSPAVWSETTHILEWRADALVGDLRAVLHAVGLSSQWVIVALPVVASVCLLIFFARKRPDVEWPRWAPPLLCVSLLTAPYGWFSDQAALLAVVLATLCNGVLGTNVRLRLFMLLLILQVLLLSLSARVGTSWFPVALLFLWLLAERYGTKLRPT